MLTNLTTWEREEEHGSYLSDVENFRGFNGLERILLIESFQPCGEVISL